MPESTQARIARERRRPPSLFQARGGLPKLPQCTAACRILMWVSIPMFYPFSQNNFSTLNLSICKDMKIDISIPINISLDEIDKYSRIYEEMKSSLKRILQLYNSYEIESSFGTGL